VNTVINKPKPKPVAKETPKEETKEEKKEDDASADTMDEDAPPLEEVDDKTPATMDLD
jgi:hypothetical protein